MRRTLRCLFGALLLLTAVPWGAGAQIVNRLKVDAPTFERYAYGRMQRFNPANLPLADSLYTLGVERADMRYKCLGLALEFPVRFALGEYERMDEAVSEIKTLLDDRREYRSFYYAARHEYCEYLLQADRMSDAMLEARSMERLASEESHPGGRMYAYRIVGLIQSYRDNSYLAIRNFEKAARYCKEARAEQELPSLQILMAQEYIRLREFEKAEEHCQRAEEYQDFFPSIRIKALMTRACLYNAEQDWNAFYQCYDALLANPLYRMQTDEDARHGIDIFYLLSHRRFNEALAKADSLGTARDRYDTRQGIYAAQGLYHPAYDELKRLVAEKDSIYIKVQNEDLAILDAEMNNAQLRQEAERLRHRHQYTILLGFIVMFAIAFFAILLGQWRLRQNLEEMKQKNIQMLSARRAYRRALEYKENENSIKVKILQNRKSTRL